MTTQAPWLHALMAEDQWQAEAEAHRARLRPVLKPWLEGREAGRKQPVMDFLFEYYGFRPSRLERWSPGVGVGLTGASARSYLAFKGFREVEPGVVAVDPRVYGAERRSGLRWIASVLRNTQAREPYLGCFGMHEWAMVYRTDNIRHAQMPLRMEPEALAAFVESRAVRCSHYDAFRFFTPAARPLNRLQPTLEEMPALEQPGCLHTNMDLYRWASKLYPWVSSGLLGEAFLLALAAREVDMRASPYDLGDPRLPPICIETHEGRAEYKGHQETLAARGLPLRAALIEEVERLLGALDAEEAQKEAAIPKEKEV